MEMNVSGTIKGKAPGQMNIVDAVRDAGVVGAGGAGFPTHIKLSARDEIVIANGAECEPLLESDRHLLLRQPEKVVEGLKLAVQAVGAFKGVIAVKRKHGDIIGILKPLIDKESTIELFLLDSFYPAGDEHVLVNEMTGRLVPMGGIPLDAGVVVNNVYTLAMVYDAVNGSSFTHRYVTVTGAVKRPAVARLPVGMRIREAVEKVGGGVSTGDFEVITGGPMMGKTEKDIEKPILKTTGGIIVLPKNSKLVELKNSSMEVSVKRAKSVCCHCRFCTDMCPRFLLGHQLEPHKIMSILSAANGDIDLNTLFGASLCSECGLCGYFSCTMGLAPNMVNGFFKELLAKNKAGPDFKRKIISGVNPFRQERKVPTGRLTARLGLAGYDRHLPFDDGEFKADRLVIALKQHTGMASVPKVKPGDRVRAGDLLAGMPEKSLGANIHCPQDGVVREVDENIVVECF